MGTEISIDFPKAFLWGTSTSSHQVEGNNINSNWWQWENTPGKIRNSYKSGHACGWWESMEKDLSLMKEMNNTTHRMSLEWSRIEPEEGKFDQAAINRYKDIILALKENGIEPMITLHHYTNPLWFENRGAWIQKDPVKYFMRYVSFVVKNLGQHVRLWCTINEPEGYAVAGYVICYFPPGRFSLPSCFRSLFNLLDAHLAAYDVIKKQNPEAQVGIVKNYTLFDPLDEKSFWDKFLAPNLDKFFNRVVLDPLISGKTPFFLPGWRKLAQRLRGKIDFFGLSYFTRWRVRASLGSPSTMVKNIFNCTPGALVSDLTNEGHPYGEIYPEGMYRALKMIARLNKPIYITGSGLPDADDSRRPLFLLAHLKHVHRALEEGIDVRGFYHWTLVDNFEWADGWALKFGLIAFDPLTDERIMRGSGRLYGEIAKEGRITRDMVERYAPGLLPGYFEEQDLLCNRS